TDRGLRQQLEALMDRVHEELRPGQPVDADRRAAQVALICSLFDGLRMRSIRSPDLPAERDAVLTLMRPVMQRILEG
ncbi:MAG: hypothetical protein VW625_08605, partial [Perlucidibaca sp.]